ncbi:MAG: Gfo/Idh/MocA family oxidoreductase [Robiginitomaculum sp.]|nr:Gfo/Idh/MocA family oxidoreductase [Robiginitomaculum sp.]
MKSDSLKIGVIGAGVFGNYHAGKCAAHPRHDFVGIFDPDHKRVREVAKRHKTRAFDNCNTLLSEVDAVIIACVAVHHGPIAIAALKAGRHVFVEKPIADSLKSAQTMVRLAKGNNLVLQVGHQERFVARAIGLDSTPKQPTKITATRFGPVSQRGTDVSVTLDLMTHDLDMAMWLMGEPPTSVDGESLCVYSDTPDAARAKLVFSGGATAHLEASRCEDDPDRVMRIDYPDGYVRIDFVNKTFEDTTGYGFNKDFADHPLAQDSLGAGTSAFTSSILDGTPVAVSGQDGLNALEVALKIDGRLS